MIVTYVLGWLPMVLLAIANGVLRESIFRKRMPELRAHQVSCVNGAAVFFVYTWILESIWSIEATAQAITIGSLWLVMTLAFEFLFGHYVMHHSWSKLLSDYNVLQGRLWGVVLAAVALVPWAVYSVRL